MAAPRPAPLPRLSIGALSRVTGIPIETLRTWETRYGFPVPERRPSGHRVYTSAIVPRLRRISEALARGHRAGQVVAASDAALATLLADVMPDVTPARRRPMGQGGIADLMEAVRRYDGADLTRRLLADWGRQGVVGFLTERVGPLVEAVGQHWANGTLEIRHEHFLTEQLGELLRTLRAPLDDRASGPTAVLATLPGEQHGLGLLMAALVMAASGLRVRVAGTDLPVNEIASLARELKTRAVVVSVSLSGQPHAARHLRALRAALPRATLLLVGGQGAPPAVAGTERVPTFEALDHRARRIVQPG
ncbi:MAG: MerR family DNA-binding transcriptional regulator [Vicinamibacteria bacterium]|nr:MerR family DNA-binding transcriptional regulator [Vicinamibacteria bacterium]